MFRKPTQKTHTGEAWGSAQHRQGWVWLGQILAIWYSLPTSPGVEARVCKYKGMLGGKLKTTGDSQKGNAFLKLIP